MPVYAILCCNGHSFEFFQFDGTTDPYSFKYGLGPNDPSFLQRPFRLPQLQYPSTTRPFIKALHPICEIIFDLLLNSYVSSLKTYNDLLKKKFIKEDREVQPWLPEAYADKQKVAMNAAVKALQGFKEAEMKCQAQLINEANSVAEEAMASLKCRYEIPTFIFSGNISNDLSFNAVWTQFQTMAD